jgi:hypothetical protein
MVYQETANNSAKDNLLFFINGLIAPTKSLDDVLTALKYLSEATGGREIGFSFDCLIFNETEYETDSLIYNEREREECSLVEGDVYKYSFTSTEMKSSAKTISDLSKKIKYNTTKANKNHYEQALKLSREARVNSSTNLSLGGV